MVLDMKELRERKKLRLIDVAYKLGISETSVRNWEHGRAVPRLTFEQVEILLGLYDCTVTDLKQALAETGRRKAS